MKQHLPVKLYISNITLNEVCRDIKEIIILFHSKLRGRSNRVVEFPPNDVAARISCAVDIFIAAWRDEIGGGRSV
jgi:hypothetical protein